MPRTPVASKILASAASGSATQPLGNVLEPSKISDQEIERILSCNGSQLAHIESQNELIASLYSKLGDLKQEILFKGLNIDLPRGPEVKGAPWNQKSLHVAIEGNIGAGKSYLVEKMRELLNKHAPCIVIPEPVSQWTAFGTQKSNILQKMYDEPVLYSMIFQMVASVTKVEELVEKEIEGVKLVERSLEAQKACFIPLLYENKALTIDQKEILDRTIDLLLNYMPGVKPDLIVYLHTTPKAAMRRIITRGRKEEEGIEMEYLFRLHQQYEGWLRDPLFATPVITIFASDVNAVKPQEIVEKIIKFRTV